MFATKRAIVLQDGSVCYWAILSASEAAADNYRVINPTWDAPLLIKMIALTATVSTSHLTMMSQPAKVAAVIMAVASNSATKN